MYVAAIGWVEEIIWLPYDAGLSTAAETLVWILKRVIVSPAVYPRFLEIAELAWSLCHSWATCITLPRWECRVLRSTRVSVHLSVCVFVCLTVREHISGEGKVCYYNYYKLYLNNAAIAAGHLSGRTNSRQYWNKNVSSPFRTWIMKVPWNDEMAYCI